VNRSNQQQTEGINLMGSKTLHKTPKVTDIDVSVDSTPTDVKDVVKSEKEIKLSKKSVNNVLGNLDGFSPEDVKQITDVFKKLEEGGKVTSGQGGGTSYDTPEITTFRNNFGKSVESVSDGFDITKTGKRLHYVMDKNGVKRYPTLYLRSKKELNKKSN